LFSQGNGLSGQARPPTMTPASPESDKVVEFPSGTPAGPAVSGSEFGALYRSTLDPLRRYLASLLGDSAPDAPDIAHDAYLRTYAAMNAGKAANPKSLLFAAARNLAYTYRTRRAQRMVPTEAAALEARAPAEPAVSDLVSARDLRATLHEAINALPPGCRQVLILRNIEGLSYNEVAARLGISLSGVEKQLQRALRLLHEEMKERLK
jgi:RNA polymerase sigma factor (sigma-70 family)